MTIPYITPRQQEIPKLIYKLRFINRLQIQRLLGHKDKRRINSWLKNLVEKEYLEKVPKGNTFEQRTKLTIYHIGINGIRFLKTHDDCSPEIIRKLYKDKERSENFINQSVFLSNIYLSLIQKKADHNGIVYEVTTNSDLFNTDSPFHFLKDLNPDLIYKENIKKMGSKSRCNLLTIFEPTLPRYSARKIIRNYLNFYFSNQWEDNLHESFPTFKLICPTKTDLIYARRFTRKLLEENQNPEDLHIKFATVDQVKEFGITGEIWEEVE